MDDSRMQARRDAIAMVARDFEPVRIERQLIARAFDLVCEMDMRTSRRTQGVTEQALAEQLATSNMERRRAA